MSNMLAAVEQEHAKQKAKEEQRALRAEYVALLKENDPAKAARLSEVCNALGVPIEMLQSDFAMIQKQANPTPTAPAPAVDTSKMNGARLIAHALKVQREAKPDPAATVERPFNPATANASQLLREGLRQQGPPKLPQAA